jgi:hypothetical protein
MRAILAFAAGLLLVPPAVFGCTPGVGPLNMTIVSSSSCAEVDTISTTPVTQRVDTYSTELRARIGNGAFLYDQTFAFAFSATQVQNAIATAHGVLAGAGAVNFSGPTQLSNSQSLVSRNTNIVTTGTQVTSTIVTSMSYVGPQTVNVGNLGICQSYVWSGNVNIAPTLTGCVPGGTAVALFGGQILFDTQQLALVNVSQTATTTNTFLTTAVYELDGFLPGTQPPATPVPPSLVLVLTGLSGAGLYEVRRRFKRLT